MPRKRKGRPKHNRHGQADCAGQPATLRIIGGAMRGRKLAAPDQERTRPMKDRVREAVFNLLGPDVAGKHALDLFAGSGALALEAISRGASGATLVEHHLPTAEVARRNATALGAADRVDVIWADTFIWAQREMLSASTPWVVFCSPPYVFYIERQAEMLALVRGLLERAPAGSMFVVECDQQFDTGLLGNEQAWDVREYSPAVVAICSK